MGGPFGALIDSPDWMPFRDTSSLPSLVDSWVGPVLNFLELHHAPADDAPHIRLLYTRRDDEMPAGLCYVVPPDQDGSTGSPRGLDDTTKGRHSMAQVVLALRARNLRWGMLTDGARWRLVDAHSLRRYEHYLEIDLDGLARSDDPAPLRLFYAFFHRSAFISSPSQGEDRERVRLDRLLAASAQATEAAEDHLKARVSHNEGILAQLCLGLVRADGRARYTEAERDAIYRDATYLLYRMLFILYAEARGLLPMGNPAYWAVSLTRLVQTAYTYKLRGMPNPQATTLWDHLKRLYTAIYESDEALSIPAYNGGLFNDANKPYLRDGHIADAYLTEALFDLAYRPHTDAPEGYQPIDYRDLSVRHLGSLYEGMIEYKLQIAEETLWARRDRKANLRFLRTGQDGAPRRTDEEIKQGSVYFSQSPGERRATGTYYTPEYIVDYIMRQTVVRGLEERRAPLEAKLAGWLEEIAAAHTSEVSETSEVSRMQRTADEELVRFIEEQVLTFQVCDPAMGSGHFLVNAAHQMTAFIVETLHLTPWENNDIDADPVAWRRQVVERCLYGVDLSLMAVELAKLSLWLASVAEGKPLSFLDHHLRQGNSLVGARLEDLAAALVGTPPARPPRRERKAREAGQLSMLEHPAFRQHVTAATDLLAQISARMVERVEDVKAQAADYEQVRAELEPYRRLADLWTARHFGVEVDERELTALARYILNGTIAKSPEYETAQSGAERAASERRFFHWSLEFPEVFFDGTTDLELGAFNAVVGNPPYVAYYSKYAERIDKKLRDWYERLAGEASSSALNTFLLFLIQGVRLVRRSGFCSMIVPDTLCINQRYEPTRRFLFAASDELLLSILRFHVFADPTVRCVIPIARIGDGTQAITACVFSLPRHLRVNRPTLSKVIPSAYLETRPSFSLPLDFSAVELEYKVRTTGDSLADLCNVRDGINPGPRSFRDEIVLKARDPLDPTIQPLIVGSDVQRYYLSPNSLWVRYDSELVGPALRTQGASLREQWIFESEKLVSRQTSDTLIFTYDEGGTYALNSVHNTIKYESTAEDILYILSLLNSKLIQWYYTVTFQETRDVFP